MTGVPIELGITHFGLAYGDTADVAKTASDYVPDPDRVMQWGYHSYHRAADDVTATDLAARSATAALDSAGLTPADADLIVLASSELPEYLHWDSSAALARELKVVQSQTLLLTEGCASGVTGLGMVAGLMAVQPEISTVLFTAVNRVSEFHRNRMKVNNAVHSDGAVSVIVRRGHRQLRWLATEQFTDPELCDWFRTDYGGAAEPLPPQGWSSLTAPVGHERIQAHFQKDPARMRAFGALAIDRSVQVVEGACARAGVPPSDLAHFIYINDPDGIADIAPRLGLPPERTNTAVAAARGHMGAADQLSCLAEQLEQGTIKPGDLVALSGISIGMRWYCTLIQA